MREKFPIRHEFVELMPQERKERILYISIPFSTAVHNCFCGCGTKVVTPIKPTGWEITYNGDHVSLRPSIGNWGLPCRSHYIISQDTVVWAGDMSQERIDRGRAHDRILRDHYYKRDDSTPISPKRSELLPQIPAKPKRWWQRLLGR